MQKYLDICNAVLMYGEIQKEFGKAIVRNESDELEKIVKQSVEKFSEIMDLVRYYAKHQVSLVEEQK